MKAIRITDQLSLESIAHSDDQEVFKLMSSVYPPAYAHYWNDDCSWYLDKIYSKKNLYRELNQSSSHYYFVMYKNLRIGIFKMVSNAPYPPLDHKTGLKIDRIYIDPQFQGKYIGRKLMDYAEGFARQNKAKFIWLEAMDTHQQAQSFYSKLGFVKSSCRLLNYPLLRDEHRAIWYLFKKL